MNTSTTSVQATIVSSEDNTHTYEVKKVLLDAKSSPAEGKDAILIGMYPTTTAEEPYKADLSTNHLVCKMPELGLRSVRILNPFSRICGAEKLSARGLTVDEENLAYLESVIKEPRPGRNQKIGHINGAPNFFGEFGGILCYGQTERFCKQIRKHGRQLVVEWEHQEAGVVETTAHKNICSVCS